MTASRATAADDRWTRAHSIGMLAGILASWPVADARPLAFAAAASILALVGIGSGRWTARGRFGFANGITLTRLGLVPVVAALPPGPPAAVLVLSILVLDGLDGWVARRFHESSAFGAKLDMETDALLVAVVTVKLAVSHRLGPWILIPGLLRYAYAVAVRFATVRAEAPRSSLGRVVFVVLVLCLEASLWPVEPIFRPLALAAAVLTAYSFAVSAYWSFSRLPDRNGPPSAPMASPPPGRHGEPRGARGSA